MGLGYFISVLTTSTRSLAIRTVGLHSKVSPIPSVLECPISSHHFTQQTFVWSSQGQTRSGVAWLYIRQFMLLYLRLFVRETKSLAVQRLTLWILSHRIYRYNMSLLLIKLVRRWEDSAGSELVLGFFWVKSGRCAFRIPDSKLVTFYAQDGSSGFKAFSFIWGLGLRDQFECLDIVITWYAWLLGPFSWQNGNFFFF